MLIAVGQCSRENGRARELLLASPAAQYAK